MDFISDRSRRHLLRINSLVEVPGYVKSASVDAEGLVDVPDHLFADDGHREFPVDTAGHAYLSHAYCLSSGNHNKHILASIKTALARFPETKADIEQLEQALAAQVKASSVSVQPQFAVYVDFGAGNPDGTTEYMKQGGVRGFYPINDEFEIEQSAVNLGNDAHKLPKELFVEGCQAIYKAASEKGNVKSLPKSVLTYGIDRLPDFEFVKQQAAARKQLTNDDVYLEIAESAEQDDDHTSNNWAELWMQADANHGIKYAKHTLDPYQIFHSGMPKAAFEQELNKWTLVAGSAVPVSALIAITPDSLQRVMSKQAAESVTAVMTKAATVTGAVLANELATLDKPIQTALLKLVAQ